MKTISSKIKWSYSVGCIGRDMTFILVAMFVLPYIQFTMNLTVAQFSTISAIMIFARVWDAINDPMMGMIIENVYLKRGKFRPWILLGGILNFFVTILMFWIRPGGWSFVLFFGIIYISWGMTYTINDISYWSLLPNLATENTERNELANLVLVFASIGQFLSGGLIPVLVTGNAVFMYKIISLVIAAAFLLSTLLTYFGVTENPSERDPDKKVTVKKLAKIIGGNDQLVIAAIALLLFTISSELFVALSLNFFYFEFGYGGEELFLFTITFAVGTLSALGAFSILSKRYSRLQVMRLAAILAVTGYGLFLVLGWLTPMITQLLYLATFTVFFSQSLFFVVIVVLIANTIEYNQLKLGERNESIIFSVRPFMTKLGAALQQLIVTIVLISSGVYVYSRQIAELEIEKSKGVLSEISQQANVILSQATDSMRLMIRLGMALIPLVGVLLAYQLIKRKYIITEEKYDEMLDELNRH